MPNLRFALAAGIIALMPLSVWADSITENFTLTVPSTTLTGFDIFPGTNFALFNPADGTLNDFNATLTGPATWTSSSPTPVLDATLKVPSTRGIVAPTQTFFSPGVITLGISGTDSLGPDLTALTGTGMTTLDLVLLDTTGDTFATSSTGLTGSITYDFTPASVPEPSLLALFSVGLASLLGFMRLRAAACFRVLPFGKARGS